VPPGMALSPIEKRLMVLHHSRRVSADRGRDLGFGGNQLDTSEDAKRRDLTARYGPDMLKWLTDLLGCRFGRAADMLELARLHASQESTGEQDVLMPAIQPAPRMSTSALVLATKRHTRRRLGGSSQLGVLLSLLKANLPRNPPHAVVKSWSNLACCESTEWRSLPNWLLVSRFVAARRRNAFPVGRNDVGTERP
jgi:hypothetical protein